MAKGVLVIGSGVGGLKASLEVAERGRRVYLVDRSQFFGGEIVQLEKQFPTNQCCLCQMLPTTARVEEGEYCLRRDFHHPLIELIPGAELKSFSGEEGDFKAVVVKRPRGVREELCTGCLKCVEACPEETGDEFNLFGTRKAISFRGPQPIPPIPAIDRTICTRCGRCIDVCPTGAIDLEMPDEEIELEVSSVILAPGFDEFEPEVLTQYGYRRWENVITSMEWERIVSPVGPFPERLRRPSDGKIPERVAFLLCVGSRERRWEFCSAACCMYGIKGALLLKELNEDCEVTVCYMDIRAYGKDYYRYVERAKEKGIRFVRGRVARLWEDPETKDLILSTFEDGQLIKTAFDLVVLAVGQRPPRGSEELARILGVELNEWGFCETIDPAGTETTRSGVYACGAFSEPKDIPETIVQATACALKAVKGGGDEKSDAFEESEHSSDEEPRIGVVLCRCGGEVSEKVDYNRLKEAIDERRNIAGVWEADFLCIQEKAQAVVEEIRQRGVNRLVVCACSPYWFRRRFLNEMDGMEPWFIEWVNLREGVVKAHGQAEGQGKAEDMVVMAVERLRRKEILPPCDFSIRGAVLIVGGGLAGLTAASALAQRGVEVHLVEKGEELGGALRWMPTQTELLEGYVRGIEGNSLVRVYTKSEVTGIRGQAGDFWALIRGEDGEREVGVGAILLATGAKAYGPKEFLYGDDERVITQRELSNGLATGGIQTENLHSVVMIQCVGSRDREHPWCSRYCCTEALENALKLKELNPELELSVLFRDVTSYGFRERLYSRARDAGVVFLRYEDKGEIGIQKGDRLKVSLQGLELDCDMLVLSPGIVPNEENEKLAEVFGLELNQDGFFKEAEVKFRPVDALREGIYLCGGCHSPRSWGEVILQAEAASERVLTLLDKTRVVTPRAISFVNERRCCGCGLCVEGCPYGARILDEERRVAAVKEALCQGCGVCSALCPNGAAKVQGFKEDQVMAMIEAVL